jgi:hypothetical protein
MKTDSEPSKYGDHMVMLSIKKKEGKKMKPKSEDEEATVKRVSQ